MVLKGPEGEKEGSPEPHGSPGEIICMRLPAKQKRSFAEFYRAARNNEQLDSRTTLMIHLAAALAVGCYP
jgi:hypothetical protein